MPQDNGFRGNSTKRRNVLRKIGAGTTISIGGLAGCTGDQGNTTTTTSDTGSGGTTTTQNGSREWADLSGHEFKFITEDSSDPMQNYWRGLARDFEDATGATVDVEITGINQSGDQRVSQLLQAGDPPAVVQSDTIVQYAQADALAPVGDVVERVADFYGELPGDSQRLIIDGEELMLPRIYAPGIRWFRGDLDSDLSQKPTWDEFSSWAERVDDPSGVRGSYVPVGGGTCPEWDFLSWAYSNGAKLAGRDSNGEVQIVMSDSDQRSRWVETLEFMKELYQYSPQATDASCSTISQVIPSESAASTWYIAARPKIQSIEREKSFASELSNFVQPKPSGGTHRTLFAFEGLATFKGSDQKAAKEFMAFQARPEAMIGWYRAVPGIALNSPPAWPGMRESDTFRNHLNNELPSQWNESDFTTILEDAPEAMQSLTSETEPPNPYSGALLGSGSVSSAVYDVCVNDAEPGATVDSYAEELRGVLETAKS